MAASFEEIIDGANLLRPPPDERHERICGRLHAQVLAHLSPNSTLELLPARSLVEVNFRNALRPDLAIVHRGTGRLWLAVEIITPHDHRVDTVSKKMIYHEVCIPRLWIVDPRYNNVEIYRHRTFGLRLEEILADYDHLREEHLTGLSIHLANLFGS